MTSSLKNILVVLGLLTIGYGAYYFYSVREATSPSDEISQLEFEAVLQRTQVFIDRRRELDQIDLNTAIFEDPRFRLLQSYEEPLVEVSPGRDNPFAEVDGSF